MKRYNINIYNGWRILINLIPILLFIAVGLIGVLLMEGSFVAGLILLVLMIVGLVLNFPIQIGNFVNCFYYDEKNNEIILKLVGREKTRIPISSIGKIMPKINENRKKGAVTTITHSAGRSGETEITQKTFSVEDVDGNDLFYVMKDPIVLDLFENLGVPVIL